MAQTVAQEKMMTNTPFKAGIINEFEMFLWLSESLLIVKKNSHIVIVVHWRNQ